MGDQERKTKFERIKRLRTRLRAVAEDDAKQHVTDPLVTILKGVLDLLEDEL